MKSDPLANTSHAVGRALVEGSDREDMVVQALQDCQAAIDSGSAIDRDAILAKYPEIHVELAACLDGLELMRASSRAGEGDAADHLIASQVVPLATLGDFRIVREIGRGGMGVVYEAEQLSIGRSVALKVLPYAAMLDKRQIARFQNEARAAATLEHPNIVPVYFVGSERGVYYYAMRLIDGKNLAEVLVELRNSDDAYDSHSLVTSQPSNAELSGVSEKSFREMASADTVREMACNASTDIVTDHGSRGSVYFKSIARLGKQVAEALEFAHSHGIIHRDIKPANIMLDEVGDAWITDFGLARIEASNGMTMTGDLVGTLRYMSPEQTLAKRITVDHRSDVYSLGATLYELLTLHPIYSADDRATLLKQIAFEDPVKPSKIDAAIPFDLETVILKALSKNPDDRYESASVLADDLNRFLTNQPVQARRTPMSQRIRMWTRRHPTVVASSACIIFAILASFSAAGIIVANKERNARLEISKALGLKDGALEQSNTNLNLAKENLEIALTAVDQMNMEVATTWIAGDQELSDTQHSFLTRSAELFSQIAERFGQDPEFRIAAGNAYLNSGEAFNRLGNFAKAETNYRSAAKLFTQERSTDPANIAVHTKLAMTWAQLGDMYVALLRPKLADEFYSLAADAYLTLKDGEPENNQHAMMLGHIKHGLSQLALRRRDLKEVIRISQEVIDDAAKINSLDQSLRRQIVGREILSTLQIVRAKFFLGEHAEASAMGTAMLKKARLELRNAMDDRELVSHLASLQSQVGHCQMELGDYEMAEANLRGALKQTQSTFLFDGTPKEFSIKAMQGKVSDSLIQPTAFMQYAEMQRILGMLLLRTNRPVEGFVLLDEALRTGAVYYEWYPENVEFIGTASNSARVLATINLNRPDFRDGVVDSLLGKQSREQLIRAQQKQVENIYEKLKELAKSSSTNFLASACSVGSSYASLLNRSLHHSRAVKVAEELVSLVEEAIKEDPSSDSLNALLLKYREIADRIASLNLENPADGDTFARRAQIFFSQGDEAKALQDFTNAIELEPNHIFSLNGAAWTLATSHDAELRDGKRAVTFATSACEATNWKESWLFDTLAAAYAEIGDFESAVKWQSKAMKDVSKTDHADFQSRLELYEQGKPFHESQ